MTQQQCVPWGFNSAKTSSLWLITLPNYPPAPQMALRFSPKGAAVLVFVGARGLDRASAVPGSACKACQPPAFKRQSSARSELPPDCRGAEG